jgi:hypothetical protein
VDAADLELFERTLRHAATTRTGGELDAELEELGWRDALLDVPRAAISLLFELQGRTLATSCALDQVLATALGFECGSAAAVVLPELTGREPPGVVDGKSITVRGLGSAAFGRADTAVVVVGPFPEDVALVATDQLELRTVRGIDPPLGTIAIRGSCPSRAAQPLAPGAWDRAVARGQLALAHELIGAMRAMLDLAREHALARIQFDRPIAYFQAVRHRLAETLVAVEAADAAADTAWEDGSPFAAAAAKAVAGRSARIVARNTQQVLGGLGFTTEHALHHYLRRVLVLGRMLGDTQRLTRTVGAELLRTRRVPLVPL